MNDFIDVHLDAVNIVSLLQKLHDADLKILTIKRHNVILGTLGQFAKVVGRMVTYKSAAGEQDRQQIIEDFRTHSQTLSTIIVEMLDYIRQLSEPVINDREKQANALYDDLTAHVQTKVDDVDKYVSEKTLEINKQVREVNDQIAAAKKILEGLNDVTAQATLATFATDFSNESIRFNKSYQLWLGISIAIFLITVGFGLYLLQYPYDKCKIEEIGSNQALLVFYIIQQSVTKILVASGLFYGLAVSIKSFRANKHNAITNKHRSNALKTFVAFSNAPGADAQTKSAVLIEATHTIFGHQNTGFTADEKDSDVPNKIIEILKAPSIEK